MRILPLIFSSFGTVEHSAGILVNSHALVIPQRDFHIQGISARERLKDPIPAMVLQQAEQSAYRCMTAPLTVKSSPSIIHTQSIGGKFLRPV